MTAPVVSVIIPAYNAQEHIEEAIRSILDQSFTDFEVLVVDDGSTDATAEKVRPFLADARVRYLHQTNQGPSAARNCGIAAATGAFINCMDADDVSHPDRLRRQVELMRADPQLVVCGTWGETREAVPRAIAPAADDAAIRANMLFDNGFIHSSVLMRAQALRQVLPAYRAMLAEDYDLWQRLGEHGRLCNIPEPLIGYRIHTGQISTHKAQVLAAGAMQVRHRELQRLLGAVPSAAQAAAFDVLVSGVGNGEQAMEALRFAVDLLERNWRIGRYQSGAFADAVFARLRNLLRAGRASSGAVLIFVAGNFSRLSAHFGPGRTWRLLRMALRRARR